MTDTRVSSINVRCHALAGPTGGRRRLGAKPNTGRGRWSEPRPGSL